LFPTPTIDISSLSEIFLVPVDTRKGSLHANFKNESRRLTPISIQKPHVFVKNEIRLCHELIRLRDKGSLVTVSLTELLIFVIGDEEFSGISKRLSRIILASKDKDLKALPTEGSKRIDM
jgi:hypothetical protein